MVDVPLCPGGGRETCRRSAARRALVDVLWTPSGVRRLPTDAQLVTAIEDCDRRDLWWVCEANSAGPVYLLPTVEWVDALAEFVDSTAARTVLEVAAGDGFLSRCLARARPSLRVIATDNHAWKRPLARMSRSDRDAYGVIPFAGITADPSVERVSAVSAVERYRPELALVCWAPTGAMVERVIRAPSSLVLELGVDGDVTGSTARTWKYRKDFLDGPLQDRALCRLDARPSMIARATRATLYYGRAHPDHGRE